MGHQIVGLAPEILSIIFRILKRTISRQEVVSLFLVCKNWREVGQPVVWASVSLANSSLKTFVAAAESSGNVCTHIRVLSLHLNTIWPEQKDYGQLQKNPQSWPNGANPRTAEQWNCLDRLAALMKTSILGLRSFSLRIDKLPEGGRRGEHHSSPQGAWMRSETLARILESLPQSCIALELDTRGRDDDPVCGFFVTGTSSHLCTSIQRVLLRLRHLRLRLGSICSSFFCAQIHGAKETGHRIPELRTLTIALNLAPDSAGVEKCGGLLPEATNHKDSAETNFNPEEIYSDDKREVAETEEGKEAPLQTALSRHLRRAVLAHKFPRATKIQVVNLESSPVLEFSHVRQQNIIEDETNILPFRLVDKEGPGVDDSTFMACNCSDEQMIGSMADLEDWLEAETWVTGRDGDRIPVDFGSLVVDVGTALRGRILESKDEYMGRRVKRNVAPWAVEAWKLAESQRSCKQTGLQ
ncbi:hypothetical protein BDR22DRAFT_852816 [Usnea florida]